MFRVPVYVHKIHTYLTYRFITSFWNPCTCTSHHINYTIQYFIDQHFSTSYVTFRDPLRIYAIMVYSIHIIKLLPMSYVGPVSLYERIKYIVPYKITKC
jgi:hypothetical protein